MQFFKHFFYFIGISLLSISSTEAQLSIKNIDFEGLKKTKPDYLNRFIDSNVNGFLDLETLKKDLQRIKNLNSVAAGSFEVDTIGTQVNIRFQLKEAFTFFPILNFGGIQGNFWYQIGFTDDNWMGRGQKLTAFYQNNDRRDNFNIYYKIPHFKRSRWGASFSLMKWASIEPLYFNDATVFYDYDNLSFGLSALYEIKRNNIVEFGLTYFTENYAKNVRHDATITPGPNALEQPKSLVKLNHYKTAIDYHYFYLSGFDNVAILQGVYSFLDNTQFIIFQNDIRYFKRIAKKGNFGTRFRLGIATNVETPFAPFVLDSYVNIRGSGNRIERGTAALVLNLEYRHTIFEQSKYAGQLVAFSDTGSWRNPGGKLKDLFQADGIQQFVGGGIRLIHKLAFNAILRVDYAVNVTDFDQRGVVIGLGQYF